MNAQQNGHKSKVPASSCSDFLDIIPMLYTTYIIAIGWAQVLVMYSLSSAYSIAIIKEMPTYKRDNSKAIKQLFNKE